MTTLPRTEPITLALPALNRAATDEIYHFLQYLQFKYGLDLEQCLEVLEDEIDSFDAAVALAEPGEMSLASFKQTLGLE
ncbi:hypothetical protein [Spirulina major]|uniref:hypothetical protein n=1 Tax=Spirulina major TaxID=270636 RepID=UPI00093523D9|nr:hypothetical protein [Spirulina major]